MFRTFLLWTQLNTVHIFEGLLSKFRHYAFKIWVFREDIGFFKSTKKLFFFMIWKNVWIESVITGQNEMRSIRENTSRLRKPLWVLNIPLRWKVNSWWLNGEEQFQGREI